MAVDQYRPTGAMMRFLKGRDKHCRWPGCRMPARKCEIDHNHDAALGGRTEICNLCCLCQRHHSMKQFTAWKVKQLDGGVIEWTSPTGRVYTDNPPGHGVHFSPEEDVPDDLWVKWTTFTGEFRITDEPADDPHEPAPF
ncbi:HNH endonuclease signature motif containing protein [Microbacterium sp. CCNWLW134]|uniref:HNH endonuclease n=1 Tax=Microbacterium sp. CCNWLW134 TaxID=3122064 RepID=UPI00300F9D77